MTKQLFETASGSVFTYEKLWQALLEHRITDAEALLSLQDDPAISMLIRGLGTPSLLFNILEELSDLELRSQGWQALFFGVARLILGQSPEALKLLKKASKKSPCRVPAVVHLAGFYLSQSEINIAKSLLTQGLKLSENIGELYLLKARLLLTEMDCDKAAVLMETAREKGCFSPLSMARFELDFLIANDEPKKAVNEAVELLANGLGEVPKESIASAGLGTLTACGALDEADNYLDQVLENDQNNIILLTHRADIAALRGQFQIAASAIQRALARDKDNIILLHKKAGLAGKGISHEQGLKTLDRIMALAGDLPASIRAGYMALYGDIYFDTDELQKAETAYRDALAVDSKCLAALAGLSMVFTSLGRIDKAEKIQDRMYSIAPVRAVQMMINTDRIPQADREIERMKDMADSKSFPVQMRASLSFSLAKVYQKKKDYSKAMFYADKANYISRSFLSYDYAETARNTDKVIGRMSKAFFDSRMGFGSDSELPVFILGMPRSGTTLVEQILGGHSKIFPGGELGMIPSMWSRLVIWEKRLGSDYQNIPDCVMELTKSISNKFAWKVEDEYRNLIPGGGDEVHITDKLPHNFKNIGLIKLLFPKARIIYCRRHPGGIALSNYFTDFKSRYGGMGFAYHKEWLGSEIANCQRLMAHWIDLFGNEIHVIDYEDLVENPKPIVQNLINYLNLEWEEQAMEFHTLDRPVRTASVSQVRQPMYKSSKEKWLHYEKSLKEVFSSLETRFKEDSPDQIPLPNHEPGLFLRGMDLLQAGNINEAGEIFQDILNNYPNHAAATHMLGVVYLHQGKVQSAHQCMELSIKLHPGNPTWYNNLAIIFDSLNQAEAAENIRQRGKIVARRVGYIPSLGNKNQ